MDNPILSMEQLRRFCYCPRQFHLSLTADPTQLRLWRDRDTDEEGAPWPDLPAEPQTCEAAASTLDLTGTVPWIEMDGQPCPVCWHGSAPASGVRSAHAIEGSLLRRIVSETVGTSGPSLHLYRGTDSPRFAYGTQDGSDLQLLSDAIACAQADQPPAPFDDDPRCGACGMIGLCLPDETLLLAGKDIPEPKRWMTPRDDVLPLHVQEQGAKIGKSGEGLVVTKGKQTLAEVHLKDVSQLVVHGNVFLTAQAIHMLANHDVPITHLSTGGWFYGITQGFGGGDVALRRAQYQMLEDPDRCLEIARVVLAAKIANQRTLLRRNGREVEERVLEELSRMEKHALKASTPDELRGYEGQAAHLYFHSFNSLLRPRDEGWLKEGLSFESRNRRPPRDPVNCLLSYVYAVLVKECTVAVAGTGLDPLAGFFHSPRPGRPSLALDIMEEFRPLLADSTVMTALNTGMLGPEDFRRVGDACWLSPSGRKAILQAWENRMDMLFTHPLFDYRCSMRRIVRLQARLLARFVRGETDTYVPCRSR